MSEQFDPTKFKSYRYFTTMIYIDETATITDVKKAVPLFIENANRGEKRTMYRGHIIVQSTVHFSSGSERKTVVYAFDVRGKDTFCITTDAVDMRDAKRIIKEKLDTPESEPLTLTFSEEEVNVPVRVRVATFRDNNGSAINTEISDFLHVGKSDERQQDKPEDTFYSAVRNSLKRA
jgi:hypothetical protein